MLRINPCRWRGRGDDTERGRDGLIIGMIIEQQKEIERAPRFIIINKFGGSSENALRKEYSRRIKRKLI